MAFKDLKTWQKAAIGIGSAAVVATIIIMAIKKFKPASPEKEAVRQDAGAEKEGTPGTLITPQKEIGRRDLHNNQKGTPSNYPSPPPAGYKKCGPVRTNHDGNYDYIKCDGVWLTKSKASPKTRSVMISVWKSLKDNASAGADLNAAYPND